MANVISRTGLAALAWWLISTLTVFAEVNNENQYDADQALAISQAVIGNHIADLQLTDTQGQSIRLADYSGKPVLISLIFTSCYHVCPAITRHLATAVEAARDVLGEDSFQVLSIGFDTANDTPDTMRVFAQNQSIRDPHWAFLSADQQTIDTLIDNIGFVYFPSPRGFDHINQVTLVGPDGVIYRQVYGAAFDLPWLLEPLKELVFNRPTSDQHVFAKMLDRIRLFCTVYDPSSGRYHFDYSLFVQIAIGAMAMLLISAWVLLD